MTDAQATALAELCREVRPTRLQLDFQDDGTVLADFYVPRVELAANSTHRLVRMVELTPAGRVLSDAA